MKKVIAQKQAIFVQHAGYRQNEYLAVLNPHDELRRKILAAKEEFANKFDAPTAKWGKPHLALVHFKQLELMEERIVNHLKIIAMGYHPIKVELKNFGSISLTRFSPMSPRKNRLKTW